MKKSINNFYQNCSNPSFFPYVWKMGGVEWEDFVEYPNDYYNASSGSVPGCIYYKDTVSFAKKHHNEILCMIADFEDQIGGIMENKPRANEGDNYYNWLTWFAWEYMCFELINYVEED